MWTIDELAVVSDDLKDGLLENRDRELSQHPGLLVNYGHCMRAYKRAQNRRQGDYVTCEPVPETPNSLLDSDISVIQTERFDVLTKDADWRHETAIPLFVFVTADEVQLSKNDYVRVAKKTKKRRQLREARN